MADISIVGAGIRGVASAVPQRAEGLAELAAVFGEAEAQKLQANTGVRTRHVGRPDQCASDLCCAAAQTLLQDLHWDPASLDALLFVSQSFDYFLPATSCCLHGRLGLSKSCAVFDVGMGCSGYVYGLWIAASLMKSGLKRILLLAGDTIARMVSSQDRSAKPLFGEAGTATALETDPEAILHFSLGTDGQGWPHLIVPAGAFRSRPDAETRLSIRGQDGNIRSAEDLYMNGAEIFTFTIREVPPLITRILGQSGFKREEVDYFIFHQANKFMLDYLAKRMGLPSQKVPLSLGEFGNVSSASIPLTIQHCLRSELSQSPAKIIMAGFGVGLSWGAAAGFLGPLCLPEVQYLA